MVCPRSAPNNSRIKGANGFCGLRQKIVGCVVCAGLLLIVSGSATTADDVIELKATHPSLVDAKLPPLISIKSLFSTVRESWAHRISPDGQKLLWLALKGGKPTIHFRARDATEATAILAEHSVRSAYWANDSRHITAWGDNDGDENSHFLLADTQNSHLKVRDITPHPGVKVRFQQKLFNGSLDYLLLDNRRDGSVFDLYRLNVLSGTETLVLKNPGNIFRFYTNQAGAVVAVKRRLPDSRWSIEVRDGSDWRSVAKGSVDDKLWIEGHPPAGENRVWAISNRGRDRLAIVKLDLNNGGEMLFYEDEHTDIQGLWVDELTYELLLAWSMPDYPRIKIFDSGIKSALDRFVNGGPVDLHFTAWTRDKSLLTLWIDKDIRGISSYLLDRQSGELTQLSKSKVQAYHQYLSRMTPIRFKARDGLTLNGYLTLPSGTNGRRLPVVLRVHGGPFSRDYWGYAKDDQFLANRGYAVLRINYRGSTGYGRAFMEAAKGQFARKMHDDLIDGVRWIIDQGIADPTSIAIYGHSYGGYATLVGLTLTPQVFAAGVDIAGVADLVTTLKTSPAYWKNGLARWHLYVGHPERPKDRLDMATRSPINFVERIKKPLLVVHGARDVRVNRAQSDQIVTAARKFGADVKYITFDDEGHWIRKWQNKVSLAHAVERFLAEHLGGRAGPTSHPGSLP